MPTIDRARHGNRLRSRRRTTVCWTLDIGTLPRLTVDNVTSIGGVAHERARS
jgi:hypothetical protein